MQGVDCLLLPVEDDEYIREALGLTLADEGCEVVEAVPGEQALELIAFTPVDVVLLDLMLPGVGGWRCAGRCGPAGTCRSSSSRPAPTPPT